VQRSKHIQVKAVTPQMKAQVKALTPADKRKLISSNISHLPLQKQKEYIRLKQLIARKEKLKLSNSVQQQTVAKAPATSKSSSPARPLNVDPKPAVSKVAAPPSQAAKENKGAAPPAKSVMSPIKPSPPVKSTKSAITSSAPVAAKKPGKEKPPEATKTIENLIAADGQPADIHTVSDSSAGEDDEVQLRLCLLNEINENRKRKVGSSDAGKSAVGPSSPSKAKDAPATQSKPPPTTSRMISTQERTGSSSS
jgi:hypothetical protein